MRRGINHVSGSLRLSLFREHQNESLLLAAEALCHVIQTVVALPVDLCGPTTLAGCLLPRSFNEELAFALFVKRSLAVAGAKPGAGTLGGLGLETLCAHDPILLVALA